MLYKLPLLALQSRIRILNMSIKGAWVIAVDAMFSVLFIICTSIPKDLMLSLAVSAPKVEYRLQSVADISTALNMYN